MLFKKTSVIGHPISHSLSPKIHNYWIKESGIRAAKYEKIDVSPQSFDSEIERLINEGYGGLNVTVPLKELAYKKANKLSEVAKTTKAVNTLVFKDGNIFGTNTDPIGFESTLPKTVIEENVKNKKCLVLGAGGAARAIVYALHKLSANIWVFNRTHDKIKILKKDMKINFKSIERSELDTNLKNFDLIVNTTSLGLAGNEANDLVDFNKTKISCYVYDLIYEPKESNFLKKAQEHGLRTQNGLKMLIGQAAASFYIWHGVNPTINTNLLSILEME